MIGKYTILIGAIANTIKNVLDGIKQKGVEVQGSEDSPEPIIVFTGKRIIFGIVINLILFTLLLAIIWIFM